MLYEATDARSAQCHASLALERWFNCLLIKLSWQVSGNELSGIQGKTREHQANKDVKSHLLGS